MMIIIIVMVMIMVEALVSFSPFSFFLLITTIWNTNSEDTTELLGSIHTQLT